MSTRRERIEARLERRREWAAKRERDAQQRFNTAHQLADQIPFGQPILVGHHSEKRHRRHMGRVRSNMDKGCESQSMAATHNGKADNIERALDRSIYSDDTDATQQLDARAEKRDHKADAMVAINKAWRKHGKPRPDCAPADVWGIIAADCGYTLEHMGDIRCNMLRHWRKDCAPFEPYQIALARAAARRDRQRVEGIAKDAELTARAAAAPNGVLMTGGEDGGYCNVRFAEKPERAIIEALKAASFYWRGGSWGGYAKNLPACVLAMVTP